MNSNSASKRVLPYLINFLAILTEINLTMGRPNNTNRVILSNDISIGRNENRREMCHSNQKLTSLNCEIILSEIPEKPRYFHFENFAFNFIQKFQLVHDSII